MDFEISEDQNTIKAGEDVYVFEEIQEGWEGVTSMCRLCVFYNSSNLCFEIPCSPGLREDSKDGIFKFKESQTA